MKKIFKQLSTIALVAALSVTAATPIFANTGEDIYPTSKTSKINGSSIISTFTDEGGLTKAKALDLIINHEAEFETRENVTERIHAWTTCNLNNSFFTPVDSYTRAFYENPITGTRYADSGYQWDSDDGSLEGFSEAYSGWFDVNIKVGVGKSFYGTE